MVHMNTHRSRHRFFGRLPHILLGALLIVGLLLPSSLLSTPREAFGVTSAEKQAEVDAAVERLDALQTEINQLAVDYDAAILAHADAESRMLDAQTREEAAKVRIAELQEQLGSRANQTYRNGSGSYIEVLFGAQSFADFISALDMINRFNNQDAQLVLETKNARAAAEAARIEYTELEQTTREKQEEIGTLKQEKEAAEVALQSEIKTLEAEAAELLAQEKLAAEAAQRAAQFAGVGASGEVSEEQWARLYAAGLQYPFSSTQPVSSNFGPRPEFRVGEFHKGKDYAAPSGTPILALGSGTVYAAGNSGGMGNYVMITHGNGITSIYMHASSNAVSSGQSVSAGEVIAYVGSTGDSTGPHLHLQVEIDRIAVNPSLLGI